jgi:hypothetical protein
MKATRTAQTMPLLILNAGNCQGLFAIMYVGIENYGEAESANISAAKMGGKDHETSSGVMYA